MNYEEEQEYKAWLEERGYNFTLIANEYSWLAAYERIVKMNNIDTISIMLKEGQEEYQTIEDLQNNDYQEYMEVMKNAKI